MTRNLSVASKVGLAVWGQRILEGSQYRDFYVCHRQYGQKNHVCHTPKKPLTRTPYCTDPSQKSRVFRDKRALKEKRKEKRRVSQKIVVVSRVVSSSESSERVKSSDSK